MPVTRDKDYPEEAAKLVEMFGRCCEGSSVLHSMMAGVEFLAWAIEAHAKAHGMEKEQASAYCQHILSHVQQSLDDNWNRPSEAGDVAVKFQ